MVLFAWHEMMTANSMMMREKSVSWAKKPYRKHFHNLQLTLFFLLRYTILTTTTKLYTFFQGIYLLLSARNDDIAHFELLYTIEYNGCTLLRNLIKMWYFYCHTKVHSARKEPIIAGWLLIFRNYKKVALFCIKNNQCANVYDDDVNNKKKTVHPQSTTSIVSCIVLLDKLLQS